MLGENGQYEQGVKLLMNQFNHEYIHVWTHTHTHTVKAKL